MFSPTVQSSQPSRNRETKRDDKGGDEDDTGIFSVFVLLLERSVVSSLTFRPSGEESCPPECRTGREGGCVRGRVDNQVCKKTSLFRECLCLVVWSKGLLGGLEFVRRDSEQFVTSVVQASRGDGHSPLSYNPNPLHPVTYTDGHNVFRTNSMDSEITK